MVSVSFAPALAAAATAARSFPAVHASAAGIKESSIVRNPAKPIHTTHKRPEVVTAGGGSRHEGVGECGRGHRRRGVVRNWLSGIPFWPLP
eukprot:3273538-Rhodomonas_salina.2